MEKREELKLNDKIKFDNKGGAVLGVLEGPVVDFLHPTRNDRLYDEELWEKTFSNPTFLELIHNGGIPGELDHPTDRDEICTEKVAVLMREIPKKDKSGVYIGKFDILDTPCGKIAYTLAKAGFKFGISSRGNGDVYGDGIVDEDTYDFKCFDLVLLPAVEKARMNLITEGLNTSKDKSSQTNYKESLRESINNASEKDKKIMLDTLSDLKISLDDTKNEEQHLNENLDDSNKKETNEVVENKTNKADDIGLKELLENLQTTLKDKSNLETKVLELQEKLAVSDTKVEKLNEELGRYKTSTATLSTSVKELRKCKESAKSLEKKLAESTEIINAQKAKLIALKESKETHASENKKINESLSSSNSTIKSLNENISSLKKEITDKESKISSLNEELKSLKDLNATNEKKYSSDLTKSKTLAESYKKLANSTVSHYINLRAKMLGVSPNEIKNKLNESYTIADIDDICENLQKYTLNINSLPFNVDKKYKINVKSSVNESLRPNSFENNDDDIDESLLKLSNVNI